jgi:hypothetical protein
MKLITQRDIIRDIANRWRSQYPASKMYKKLLALNLETVTAKEIDAIVGNDSWTRTPRCSECGKQDGDDILQVGQEPDCESETAWLCMRCFRVAVDIVGLERIKMEQQKERAGR